MVASHYREIKVVVVGMPSNVVWAGIIHTSGKPPSTFTLGGKPVPFLPYAGPFTTVYNLYAKGLLALDKHRDAIIPVERINGPVMLICGKADTLWPSCPMAELVAAREKRFRHRVQILEYPDAGHGVFGQPRDPKAPDFAKLAGEGGSPQGNNIARQDSWTRSLAFFDAALKR
jgi:pimeloyl-ACP methyl ester carboxylesterase